jgi:hypothetical protein
MECGVRVEGGSCGGLGGERQDSLCQALIPKTVPLSRYPESCFLIPSAVTYSIRRKTTVLPFIEGGIGKKNSGCRAGWNLQSGFHPPVANVGILEARRRDLRPSFSTFISPLYPHL